ncbi:MAG: hypothetical protein MZV70_59150 [Desulfobacterales bacterium]|nr:hypothetical protein [Desulfobacterales bacterium]
MQTHRVFEKGGAFTPRHHLAHGTGGIKIDDVEMIVAEDVKSLPDDNWITAEELDPDEAGLRPSSRACSACAGSRGPANWR